MDGKPVVVVSSESKAKEVLERLKKGILAVSQGKTCFSGI